jgi:hypothetical protein
MVVGITQDTVIMMMRMNVSCVTNGNGGNMNERIKELAEQAGLSEGVFTRHDGAPCNLKGYSMLPEQMQKFSELIVKECLTFVRPNSYFQAYPDNMIGGEDGVRLLETITNQIEEHFGIEE